MADYTNGVAFPIIEDKIKGSWLANLFTGNPPEVLDGLQDFFPDDEHIGLDESLTTGVAFYYPTMNGASDSVTVDTQYLPVIAEASPKQTILESGSGEISVYGSGFSEKIIFVRLKYLPMEKLHRLYKFMINIVKGALRTFEYIDESGTLYSVRWVDDTFPREMKYWLLHDIVLKLRKEI